ncbi:Peptidase [Tangfeifania diversioriginum]|uniref:Peptidase n=1 Tax=Tangfeifania diversioriginum TaxID=1168035 RepID=A0A1M6AB25_9BACT|nr:basic secretory protein-like protein [Tangfeifania diversioriginum]SHI33660.1 Peptidase [Tangfeifania diversioriginum]
MNRRAILLFVVLFTIPVLSISATNLAEEENYIEKDSLTRDGFTLIFINKDSDFSDAISEKLKETFFEVYPELVNRFNQEAAPKVVFVIEPKYEGVAATSGGRVVFSPAWYEKNPDDIDVVTHEVMHIVQDYGRTNGPWWLTEGIADYVRYRYGVGNEVAGWKLPDVNPDQNYTNSYRITARFLAWLEEKKDEKIVDKLDKVMREHKYRDEVWVELTGKSVDELWKEYITNPVLL